MARILSGTRFRVLIKGETYHTKCPKTYCFERDSLRHLLGYYGLSERVEFGADAVPFLVKMARVSLAPEDKQRIPHLLAYEPELLQA